MLSAEQVQHLTALTSRGTTRVKACRRATALTALACSPAPAGRSHWSLRLLAGKAIKLGHCGRMLASSAHGIFKKTSCGPS